MSTLESLIDQHKLGKFQFGKICELKRKCALAKGSGFTSQLTGIKTRLVLARAKQKIGKSLLILKRPAFSNTWFYPTAGWNLKKSETIAGYNHRCVILKQWKLGGFLGLFMKKDAECLWELDTDEFKGHVPENILKATIDARQLGLHPKVWFVSKVSEFHNFANIHRMDPAVIGYPIIRPAKNGNSATISTELCVLIGIWGKDVEAINRVLECGER